MSDERNDGLGAFRGLRFAAPIGLLIWAALILAALAVLG